MRQYFNRLMIAIIAAISVIGTANAQTPNITGNEFATQTVGKTVVGTEIMCLNSSNQSVPVGPSCANPIPVTGTFSASLGGFTPSASGARGTPISVTTSDSNGSLPTGAVVVASNVGSNPMYCNVNGVAATTSDQLITSGGGWFAFTIPAGGTVLHCIATGGSTTANTVGGSGLATGTGGGGAGGGGGSVTQGTTPWVDSVTTWGGGTLGAMANYGTSPGSVLVPGINAFITNTPTVTANAGTNLNTSTLAVETGGNLASIVTDFGAPGATACTTDTASCNLNQQMQRNNQRLTTINTTLGTPFQAAGALGAGQASLGNVGALTKTVCATPTVTNGTYAANVVVGGLLTLANLFTSTGHGTIQTVALNFNTVQTVGFKLYPFRASPTNASTWTDHSAAAISGFTDIALTDQPIQFTNADSSLGTMTNYGAIGLGQAYNPAGTSGFFILIPTATTASLGATANAVQVCLTVLQDS